MGDRLRKISFNAVLVLLPFVVLGAIEGGLRVGGYASDTRSPFKAIQNEPGWTGFNPEYASRYFRGFLPAVAFNPFREVKQAGAFRVVVLGGSSTAGFPYQWYDGFPAALERRLQSHIPGRPVDVVNLGMTAVNSYTLWDISRHVVDMDPDAVVIYAGHNEFYGALGVGNTAASAPKGVWFGRMQLLLKRSALYTLLERAILGPPDYGLGPQANERTMMAKVVQNAAISFEGEDYKAGIEQFRSNMDDVLDTFSSAGIPVFAGTLVANLSGQEPLSRDTAAMDAFAEGQELQARNRGDAARAAFQRALDLDGIRFRASSDINTEIASWNERDGVTVVDMQHVFDGQSESGIPGFDLFTDHLHPTLEGYDLMARAFFGAITRLPALGHDLAPISIPWETHAGTDPMSISQAAILIDRLLADYPFQAEASAEDVAATYARLLAARRSSGRLGDSLAVAVLTGGVPTQQGLYEGVRISLARADTSSALRYYRSLLNWQPFNEALMREAVALGLNTPAQDPLVEQLALFAGARHSDAYFWNALGVTQLRQNRLPSARSALTVAEALNPSSPVMLYNRARLELAEGDTLAARQTFERYRSVTQ